MELEKHRGQECIVQDIDRVKVHEGRNFFLQV